MRWELSEIWSYRVHARDGSLGSVSDLYFDDAYWKVRYLVVTGASGQTRPQQRLLAPEAISRTDRECGLISMALRQAAVHGSPAVAAARTLPRQEESKLRAYYGLPDYWPEQTAPDREAIRPSADGTRLYSLGAVLGYHVYAGRDDIGCLCDLVIDDRTWAIQSLEVTASSWLPTQRLWIQPACIQQVREFQQQIVLTIPRAAIMSSLTAELPQQMVTRVCAPWAAQCQAGPSAPYSPPRIVGLSPTLH